MKELENEERRREWVYERAAEMGSEPRKEWFQIIRALSISINAFDSDFSEWIRSGIIRNLTLTFKQEYKYCERVDLSSISAGVLQDIFFNLPSHCPQVKQIA